MIHPERESSVGLYLFNSLVIVTCIVALGLLVNSLMAYALARMTFPGSKLILILVVIPFRVDSRAAPAARQPVSLVQWRNHLG